MRKAALFLLLALAAGPASAGTVYYASNPANDTGASLAFSAGPYDGIGDSIGLGSSLFGTDAILQLFNDGGSDGTFDATLTFFQAGSPVGAQIGSPFTLTGNTVAAGSYVDLDFALGYLSLPANVVFLLQVTNASTGVDLGVELYSNPTSIGTNTADTFIALQGSTYSQLSTGGAGSGNPFFELSGVPEPSTWMLAGVGLALTAWRRAGARRRA